MRTRSGLSYSSSSPEDAGPSRRRPRFAPPVDPFEALPDDLLAAVLSSLAAAASSPADLANAALTCRRFHELGATKEVLRRASASALAVKAKSWSDSAHRFLKQCADAGNAEAAFILGMIRFYCLNNRQSGAALMARAALRGHPPALYSLAVIQFNGSGGTKEDKDLRAGAALCARAAALGHLDALREIGHCLNDGYGVRRNVADGRRLLIHANLREMGAARAQPPPPPIHPANNFLVEWFSSQPIGAGMRLCSHARCGRAETRRHEFRRCSVCGTVNYCSRSCQAMHWKAAHKVECTPEEIWHDGAAAAAPLMPLR